MTKDDIIRMALEAGTPITPEMKPEDALAIAFALGKAEEREACAKVCEAGIHNAVDWNSSYWDQALEQAASVIRARGQV